MDLSIPLLAVQADLDSLAHIQECPHDDVPNGACSLIIEDEVKDHCEEDQEKRLVGRSPDHTGPKVFLTCQFLGTSATEQRPGP